MDIKSANFIISLDKYNDFNGIGLKQIAVLGKSNVGKSSLINSLCKRNKLCKTSSTPGKTRLINIFNVSILDNINTAAFHLVDLPGYGYAKVNINEKIRWGSMMEDYFQNSKHLVHILHLVDIRHNPTSDDIEMNQFLRAMNFNFTVVATKADKISKAARGKQLVTICRILNVQPWEIIAYSSENKDGRDKLLTKISEFIF